MIKSITVTNHLNESIKLELRSPEKSGFLVQEIDGLGPCKANINAVELATTDGAFFNSARLNSRNILLSLILLEKPTVETTRQKTYKYFPIKRRVKLLIETDNRACETYGYVESNEPDIFSSQENTKISIICPDPYFYSAGIKLTTFAGVQAEFEFPFSNESVSESLLIMGEILINQQKNIYYNGDAEIGIDIEIYATGTVVDPVIYNTTSGESMKIDTTRLAALTGSGIIAGDQIFISTSRGEKSIYLFRDGVYINILNSLDKDVDWIHLVKGDNLCSFTATEGGAYMITRIWNKTIYEGA